MLEMLGLDTVANAVYQAMLAEPGFGVAQLCEHLNLSETQVRNALDDLADLSLLRESRQTPGMLRVVSPEIGLEVILRRQEEDLARRQQELAANKSAVARAVAKFADLRPDTAVDGAKRLVGLDAVQNELETLWKTVVGEVLSVTTGAAIPLETLESGRPIDMDMLSRGITIQVLYQDSVRNDPATYAYARWMSECGGQVRTAPLIPPRLLIYDRTVALVPIDPADTRTGALCTREPGIVASLVALHQQAWATAVPLGFNQPGDLETGLTPGERDLLKLLSTGMTDETAAKRLGISLRTVRRQMAALMERLDAASRFEAGLKAAQKGWLDPASPPKGSKRPPAEPADRAAEHDGDRREDRVHKEEGRRTIVP
jgi:DNA-binding CsgD family transcriptional regulator